MTKTIKRLLPAALAVLLAGCAMQPVDSTTTRYRVALIAKNNRDSEFWDAVFIGAEAAATEYNLQLTITAPDDEEDYAAQNQLIADAVEDGAQAIVFSAIDYEANAAAIDAAAAAGVTVISVDSAVNSDNVAAYIGADNYGAGRMVAQSALDGMEGATASGLSTMRSTVPTGGTGSRVRAMLLRKADAPGSLPPCQHTPTPPVPARTRWPCCAPTRRSTC